jgi:hypothetical protein
LVVSFFSVVSLARAADDGPPDAIGKTHDASTNSNLTVAIV